MTRSESTYQKIIDYIAEYRETNDGCSPAMSEISQVVYGYPEGKGNIQPKIKRLVAEGYLKYSPNGRMLMLTRRGHEERYTRGEK